MCRVPCHLVGELLLWCRAAFNAGGTMVDPPPPVCSSGRCHPEGSTRMTQICCHGGHALVPTIPGHGRVCICTMKRQTCLKNEPWAMVKRHTCLSLGTVVVECHPIMCIRIQPCPCNVTGHHHRPRAIDMLVTYLSGTSRRCQHGAKSHFGRVFSPFGLMHQNVVLRGGVCVCLLKSVRKGRFRNVWVGGGWWWSQF